MNCPNCLFENPVTAKFCMQCGTRLSQETSLPIKQQLGNQKQEYPQSPQAERRQVSVMFCDLVGSTALSKQIDPEDLREIILAYRQLSAEAIHRNGGRIAQSYGDGLMVFFGYPVAYEDNAQRAIRAGFGIIADMEQLNARLMSEKNIKLDVRIGIHTGRAVLGEMGNDDTHEQMAIIGDTPNIASRIQTVAPVNTVVISAATYKIIQGYFECQSLGYHSLKGVPQPMEVYGAQQEKDVHNRLEAATGCLTPYVGREQELETLLHLWQQVQSGNGQVVLITGEAGIGKSRLVQVFKEQIANDDYVLRECYCSPYYQNSALYPVIDLLERQMHLASKDSPEIKLAKLEQLLHKYECQIELVIPLLAHLLSIPLDERYPALNLSAQVQKQKTLESLVTMVMALAAQQSYLLIFEDLHWVDPSTIELLNLIAKQASQSRVLLLCTARPGFNFLNSNYEYFSQITIKQLSESQTKLLIQQITGDQAVPESVIKLMVAKSDRIPLFIEEMAKMALESRWLAEGEAIDDVTIPDTIQDLLMAKLDRLGTAKEVAQIAAIIGRKFSYEVLRAVSPLDTATLNSSLTQLVNANLLIVVNVQASYVFKHSLIHDAAYESLLKSTRKNYHQKLVQVLEEQFPEFAETEPELLAYHYTKAELKEQAIHYWQLAGQKAVASSANLEAIEHLHKGLELLLTMSVTPERNQQELAFQTTLGTALVATKGYAALEVELAYKRSEELCEQIGETPKLFWVLRGLWAMSAGQGRYQTSLEYGQRLMSIAIAQQDRGLELESHFTLGLDLFWLGEFANSREHFEQGIALYEPQLHHSHAFITGQDVGVASLAVNSWNVWLLGFPEAAMQYSEKAIALAKQLSHPYSLTQAQACTSWLYQFLGETQTVLQLADAVITLAQEQSFPFWLGWGNILRGWAIAHLGEAQEGIAQICKGLTTFQSTGTQGWLPYFLALLSEAYGKLGQPEEALVVVAKALSEVKKTGECFWEAELYRIKGEHLRVQLQQTKAQAQEAAVEECFLKSLDISRRQGAKSLELKATISLARLWQQQGKNEPARQILSQIYGSFSEGFKTKDLQEALALLAKL